MICGGSVKKHVSQMTSEEKSILQLLIQGKFLFSCHSLERIKQRHISLESVKQAIKEGNIIEYHLANGIHSRVLLRSRVPFRNNVTCVVVDLNTNYVVTAYKNWYLDNHSNLNMEEYDETLNILESLQRTFNSNRVLSYR